MSLRQQLLGPIPQDTARVAKAAFKRKKNPYIAFADNFRDLFEYHDFEQLYSRLGQSAVHPAIPALLTLVQFAEGLTDRDAIDFATSRIDIKYLLHLELVHDGFCTTMLSDFRARLIEGEAEQLLFQKILDVAATEGLLKPGTQRTDSTHVLAAVRDLNRLELLVETVRFALDTLADLAPKFVLKLAKNLKLCRAYQISEFSYRRPKTEPARIKMAEDVGEDGFYILDEIDGDPEHTWLNKVDAVKTLRLVWEQQFSRTKGGSKLRSEKELPAASERISSPRDLDARSSTKRSTSWLGYKAHVTETCGTEGVNFITHVHTTTATESDSAMLPVIQRELASVGLKPKEHLVDAGYTKASVMLSSREQQGIEVIGPLNPGITWQAPKYQSQNFSIDWEKQQATCPTGVQSQSWRPRSSRGSVEIRFPAKACGACPVRIECTKSKEYGRMLEIKERPVFDFAEQQRQIQKTQEYKLKYAIRAGIEGTISKLVRFRGIRRSRYMGQPKTALHNVLCAAAINFSRLAGSLLGKKISRTRLGRFANLTVAVA